MSLGCDKIIVKKIIVKKIIVKRKNFEKFPGPLKLKKTLDKYR